MRQLGIEAFNGGMQARVPYGMTEKSLSVFVEDITEPGILGYHKNNLSLCCVDGVSRAKAITLMEIDFSLWTVSAWQILRDGENVLGPQSLSHAFDELHELLEAADTLLLYIIDGDVGTPISSEYSPGLDHLARTVLANMSYMRLDWVRAMGGPREAAPGLPLGESRPLLLLHSHPIFYDLALQSARLWMHSVGSALENSSARLILRMTHMYNLCKVDASTNRGEEFKAWSSDGK